MIILGNERADELASNLSIRSIEPYNSASYRIVPTITGSEASVDPNVDEYPTIKEPAEGNQVDSRV